MTATKQFVLKVIDFTDIKTAQIAGTTHKANFYTTSSGVNTGSYIQITLGGTLFGFRILRMTLLYKVFWVNIIIALFRIRVLHKRVHSQNKNR